jgi:hypothetical protein
MAAMAYWNDTEYNPVLHKELTTSWDDNRSCGFVLHPAVGIFLQESHVFLLSIKRDQSWYLV